MDMMKKEEQLFLSLKDRLPFNLEYVDYDNDIFTLSNNNRNYYLYRLNDRKYKIIYSLGKSKFILKPIFTFKDNDIYLLYEEVINKSSSKSLSLDALKAYKKIYNEFSFKTELNKLEASILQNLFKVLDSRFTGLEFRIRELELKPKKNDLDWIILSKYHVILDARIYLFDLETDIFKMVDKKESMEYGLIFKDSNLNLYKNGLVMPKIDVYYGPIASMLARYYIINNLFISDDEFKNEFNDLSIFNKRYFLFLSLYICILNINIEFYVNNTVVQKYLSYTNLISRIIKKYGEFAK